jgi:hypothetical protein
MGSVHLGAGGDRWCLFSSGRGRELFEREDPKYLAFLEARAI